MINKFNKLCIIAMCLIAFSFELTSCKKDLDASPSSTISKTTITNDGIPYFSDEKELIGELLARLNERNKGDLFGYDTTFSYTSIGGYSDRCYSSIIAIADSLDYASYSAMVNNNLDQLSITEVDGEECCLPRYYNTPLRYIANLDGLFQVGNVVTRIFEEGNVSTNINNVSSLRSLPSFEMAMLDTMYYCFPNEEEEEEESGDMNAKGTHASYFLELEDLCNLPSWIYIQFNSNHSNHSLHDYYVNKQTRRTADNHRITMRLFYNTFLANYNTKLRTAFVQCTAMKRHWTLTWLLNPTNMNVHVSTISCVDKLGVKSSIDKPVHTSSYLQMLYVARVYGLLTSSNRYVHFRSSKSYLTSKEVPSGCSLIWGDQAWVE